ncbi:glycerate kinase [Micromonospora mirobrigensis]|uniref:Glycerate kinase family protein n=1 Tax=Micromonospora mirobrigensis TaxID=262898 RepID=A0A1C5AKY3_9ACTN|nr:glycerate kinase [Micromonospora mirobrigensis]SCF45859.1 Glycerate kinase family protein [Micromonospora mirobrigensis]
MLKRRRGRERRASALELESELLQRLPEYPPAAGRPRRIGQHRRGAPERCGLSAYDCVTPQGATCRPAASCPGWLVDLAGLSPPPPGGVACLVDVTAPLLGPAGVAARLAPQTGATAEEVAWWERGLGRRAELLGGRSRWPGACAAGGTGYELAAAWGAIQLPGARTVAEVAGLPAALVRADLVVTGESRFDDQPTRGKVVGHVLDAARDAGAPVRLVAGRLAAALPSPVVEAVDLTMLADGRSAAMTGCDHWLVVAGRRLARRLRPCGRAPG